MISSKIKLQSLEDAIAMLSLDQKVCVQSIPPQPKVGHKYTFKHTLLNTCFQKIHFQNINIKQIHFKNYASTKHTVKEYTFIQISLCRTMVTF